MCLGQVLELGLGLPRSILQLARMLLRHPGTPRIRLPCSFRQLCAVSPCRAVPLG